MNEIGVIFLSVFAGMLILALLAGIGVLIWNALYLRKSLAASQGENREFRAAIEKLLVEHRQESKATLESAKASFQAIKSETSKILDLNVGAMREVVSRINADAIVQNISRFIQTCGRLETAIGAFQKLILDNLETENTNRNIPYGPEEPAPERTEFGTPASQYSISPAAQYDADADREEAAAVTAGPSIV